MKRRRPPIPWTWEHVHAAHDALEYHLGAGKRLACYAADGKPCFLTDSLGAWESYARHAGNALGALRDGTGRLTFHMMDAICVALEHAMRHPPQSGDIPVRSPYPYGEAGQILEVWLRDYDRRLT